MPTKTEGNLAALLDAVKTVEPALSTQSITAAIRSATDHAMLGKLVRSIAPNPRVLLDAAAAAMPAHSRLIDELLKRGAQHVVRPTCVLCGEAVLLEYKFEHRRICRECYTKNLKAECCICKRMKQICSRIDGKPRCAACHARDPQNHEICSICNALAYPRVRPNGRPVCQLCYEPPKHRCTECSKPAPAQTTQPRVLCKECYQVIVLGKPVRVLPRANHRPMRQRICATCGEKRLCTNFLGDQPQCTDCAGRPKSECVSCRRERPVQAIWEIGPVCNTCYDGKRGMCNRCDHDGLVIKFGDETICHSCAGKPSQSVCAGCGQREGLYERDRCARCVLDRNLTELLRDGSNEFATELLPVKNLLLEHPSSESVLGWLRKSAKATHVLGALARRELELSHAAFDALGAAPSISFLRSLLMSCGVLPERSHNFSLLLPWLGRFFSRCPEGHRSVLSAFAQWHVFRRLRDKARFGDISESSNRWARARLRCAAAFMKYVDSKGHTLKTCRQALLDEWLAHGPTSAYLVRDFVFWSYRRNLMQQLVVPLRKVKNPVESIDVDARWSTIRRLTHDDTIPADLRVAGALNLLFGQHVSRVVRLTDAHVVSVDDEICVVLGREPTPLPDPFGRLILELAESRRRQKPARLPSGHVLLFPGKNYGKPTTTDVLTDRFKTIGITARAGRNAALMEVAATLPAPVLRDLLGIHINVAVLWNRAAGHSYANYVGRLKRQRDSERKRRKRRRSNLL